MASTGRVRKVRAESVTGGVAAAFSRNCGSLKHSCDSNRVLSNRVLSNKVRRRLRVLGFWVN
jgi:hypothetical protein